MEPALEKIEFIARAITPTYRVRRFDTRFFLVSDTSIYANLDAPANPSGELEDVRWVPLTETRGLDLPGVTRWVLEQVEIRLGASSNVAGKFPIPFVQFINGTTLERLL